MSERNILKFNITAKNLNSFVTIVDKIIATITASWFYHGYSWDKNNNSGFICYVFFNLNIKTRNRGPHRILELLIAFLALYVERYNRKEYRRGEKQLPFKVYFYEISCFFIIS